MLKNFRYQKVSMSKRQKVEDSVNSSSDEEMDHEDIDWNSRVDQELDFEFQR